MYIAGLVVQYTKDDSNDLLCCWYGSRHLAGNSSSLVQCFCYDNLVADEILATLVSRINLLVGI